MTKILNQIIFFFLHQNQIIFVTNIENRNIYLERNQTQCSIVYEAKENVVSDALFMLLCHSNTVNKFCPDS
jgi:hypothetical protein